MNLGLSLNFLLANSLHNLDVLIRGWRFLLIRVDRRIGTSLRSTTELHPDKDNSLTNEHTNSRSRHTESHTNEDRHQDHLNGRLQDHSHLANETAMVLVMLSMVTSGLELNVGRKNHRAVRKTVGHAALVTLVMRAVVVLVAGELVEAFHAEALHSVGYALGGCFGLVHAGDDFGEDAAEDVFTFGVGCVGGGWNDIDGLESELGNVSNASYGVDKCNRLTLPSASVTTFISRSSILTIWPSRPIRVMMILTSLLPSVDFLISCSML